MLSPTLLTTSTWPIAGDVPDLNVIVDDQARAIADQEALLHAYQGVLSTAQAPPPTTAIGTGNTTNLTITSITAPGVILVGAAVTGTGVPVGTTITNQQSGVFGGVGVYTTSVATTAAGAPLTFIPGGGPGAWPTPQDAATLNLIVQAQTAVLKNQTALLQQYQSLLNLSQTAAPPTGP